jgi:acyl-CoA synthetase (AMP-forming)/AMP-acid ligase II/NAD(P)-dependent dehydrogenase (short-subunit alcohol dehydrogenase family)/aryl carrier-like protein
MSAPGRPPVLEQLGEALGRVPGVEQVAVLGETVVRAPDRTSAATPAAVPMDAPGGAPATPPPVAPSAAVRLPAEAYGGELPGLPGLAHTLQQALRQAASGPAGLTYLPGDGSHDTQSYADLLHEAQRMLGGLRALGLRAGESVLFQMEDNRSFVTAFWACVLGGYLPTPVAPAHGYRQENDTTRKLRSAWELLGHPLIVTDRRLADPVRGLGDLWGTTAPRVAPAEDLLSYGERMDWFLAGPDDPVLHLLTSGSTGAPKCVRHSSRSLLAMVEGAAVTCGFGADDVTLNWFPLDHVGGLVMTNVRDVALGCRQINAKLGTVLADPLVWLEWVQSWSVTNTWAPNFMFALVNERADEVARRSWDLSSLRHITNGGEAVVPATAHRFLHLMRPHGLRSDAMRPVWGMSETASGVTFSRLSADDEAVGTVLADPGSLTGELRLLQPGDPAGVVFAEVGPPVPGVRLRIVDRHGRVVPEGTVGRLQITGATMMTGYHGDDEANRQAFTEDGWFGTGDLGFLLGGRLTITGRDKDLVIIRGANHHLHDIESLVEQVEGVAAGSAAATAYRDAQGDTDRLAVFFVPAVPGSRSLRRVVDGVRGTLLREIGLAADAVVPLSAQELPRTPKGTVARSRLAALLAEGAFSGRLHEPDAADQARDPDRDPAPAHDGLPAWFFERTWCEAPAHPNPSAAGGGWLLFEPPGTGLGEALGQALAPSGGLLTVVRPGTDFLVEHDGSVLIDPAELSHYERLLALVERRQHGLTTVVHGWGLPRTATSPDPAVLLRSLQTGVLSILLLLRHLASRQGTRLLVLTADAFWTGPDDRPDWTQGAVQGLIRTADVEAVLPFVRQVDLSVADRELWADRISAEAAADGHTPVVALRGERRLVPRLRGAAVEGGLGGSVLVPGGAYLITGGLGGIGYELAQHLLAAYQARLLIVGREPVTDGAPGGKAGRLAALRELAGPGDVRYAALDVAESRNLADAVSAAEQAWDARLAGVFHLASAPVDDVWQELEAHTVIRSSRAEYLRMYQAKLFGTAAIGQLLDNRSDCPLVLFSSVNAELGGTGFGAYASANSFLDGFADHWGRTLGRPVWCLHWSMWPGTGVSNGSPLESAARHRGFYGISPAAGIASLLAALAHGGRKLLIGLDGDSPSIRRELADDQFAGGGTVVAYCGGPQVTEERLRQAAAAVPGVDAAGLRFVHLPALPADRDGTPDRRRILQAAAARPQNTGRRRQEPVTGAQRAVADIWQDILGETRVGLDDTFFELGGTSLKASQLVARLGTDLGADVALHHLYENPTVRHLAKLLETGADGTVKLSGWS